MRRVGCNGAFPQPLSQETCRGIHQPILTPVISIAFFVLVVVTFAQVVFRYLIGYSLYWSEEAARYLFVWISFLGS